MFGNSIAFAFCSYWLQSVSLSASIQDYF